MWLVLHRIDKIWYKIGILIENLMQGYGNAIANALEKRVECAPWYGAVLHIETLGPLYLHGLMCPLKYGMKLLIHSQKFHGCISYSWNG